MALLNKNHHFFMLDFEGENFVFSFFLYIFAIKNIIMKFSLIACINEKLAIGKENNLLYHISNDMKNFSSMTTDNVVIMGRKTFDSLPNRKPLDNRINIVITSSIDDFNIDGEYDNLFIVDSVDMAVKFCEAYYYDKECFVIGGESIYNQFIDLNLIDTMYITNVNDDADGDTYFPNVFDDERWKIFYKSYTQRHRPTDLTYTFAIYKFK